MRRSPVFPLTIFYDGSCIVCATEMQHYRRKNHGGRLIFVDISDPNFEPDRFGRSLQDFMGRMHAIDAEGVVFQGVDAFPAIWQAFPDLFYRLLGKFIRLPGIHQLARFGYSVFARFRLYLPKRTAPCDKNVCHPRYRR